MQREHNPRYPMDKQLSPSNERTLTSCDSPSTFYLGLDKNRTEEPPCSRLATSGGLRNEEFRSTSGDYPDVASSRLSESRSTSPNREGRRTSLAQPPKKRPRNRASVLQEDQWAIGGQSLSAAFRSTSAISGQQHTCPVAAAGVGIRAGRAGTVETVRASYEFQKTEKGWQGQDGQLYEFGQ